MDELKAYYQNQTETQPEPSVTVQPTIRAKPRSALRHAGLIAASLVVTFTVTLVSVPSVRAAVVEILTQTFFSVETGEPTELPVHTPPAGLHYAYAKYSNIATNTRLNAYDAETGASYGMSIGTGTKYTDPQAFREALLNSGFPVPAEDSLAGFRNGNISHLPKGWPDDTVVVNEWIDSGFRIVELADDPESCGQWAFSAMASVFDNEMDMVRMKSYSVSVGPYGYGSAVSQQVVSVSVPGWESAAFSEEGGGALFLIKPIPKDSPAFQENIPEDKQYFNCTIYGNQMTLEELIAVAEKIQ